MCMHPVAERVYDERFASTHNQLLDCTKNVQFGDEITYGVVSGYYEEDNPDGTHIGDSIHMRVKTLDECRCSADGTLQSIRWTGRGRTSSGRCGPETKGSPSSSCGCVKLSQRSRRRSACCSTTP